MGKIIISKNVPPRTSAALEETNDMPLQGKTAIVHGAGGAVGGAVASAFADAGARVFLAGRNRKSLDVTAARNRC